MVRRSAVSINTLSMVIKSDVQGMAKILFSSSYVVKLGILSQLVTRHIEKLSNEDLARLFHSDSNKFTAKVPCNGLVDIFEMIRLSLVMILTDIAFSELERVIKIRFKDNNYLIDPSDSEIDYDGEE